jgi:hypothetical protein
LGLSGWGWWVGGKAGSGISGCGCESCCDLRCFLVVEYFLDFGVGLLLPRFVFGFLVQRFEGLAVEFIAVRVSDLNVDEEEDECSEEKALWVIPAHRTDCVGVE